MKKTLLLLVTPLTNRKTKKAVEQSFTSNIETIDFNISNVNDALKALGLVIEEDIGLALDKEITDTFTDTSDIFDARYFVAYNIKNIMENRKPAYKVPVNLIVFDKLKAYLKTIVSES